MTPAEFKSWLAGFMEGQNYDPGSAAELIAEKALEMEVTPEPAVPVIHYIHPCGTPPKASTLYVEGLGEAKAAKKDTGTLDTLRMVALADCVHWYTTHDPRTSFALTYAVGSLVTKNYGHIHSLADDLRRGACSRCAK